MNTLKDVLREAVRRRLVFSGGDALLFSGGTDSLTILRTLLDAGVCPTCYVFRLRDLVSADAEAAAVAAEHWGVPLVVVTPPEQGLQELARDVGEVARLIKSARKTHVEVMWAFWHLAHGIKEQNVWSGIQADTLYGSSRSMAIKYAKDENAFLDARRKMIMDPDQEGLAQAQRLFASFGKTFLAPYTDDAVREHLMSMSWRTLNRPRQKMPALAAFAGRFGEVAVYRRNDNLQCGSGTREHMARLLRQSTINVNGWRSAARLYADLAASAREVKN